MVGLEKSDHVSLSSNAILLNEGVLPSYFAPPPSICQGNGGNTLTPPVLDPGLVYLWTICRVAKPIHYGVNPGGFP